ncbi:MAG: STAS domain-containing protein [Candidatus Aenigmatarchaeota archaeon]|nr:STAS domain-containing protein [Nanoarchaeota archaeon]
MKLTHEKIGDIDILRISVKLLRGQGASRIHDRVYDLLDSGSRKFILNLSGIDWMDSTSLGILISAYTNARNADAKLVLCGVEDKIQSLLTTTKLKSVFEIFENEEDAIKALESE